MTPSDGGVFHVLVASPELPPAAKTAQVIAKFTGGMAFDAQQKARHAWGFLGEHLSAVDAERLVSIASEMGVQAKAVEKIAPSPAPEPVHWLRASPEALLYTPGTTDKEEHPVPWDRVALLSAAPLKETTSTVKTVKEGPSANERAIKMGITMVTGIPLGFGGGAKEVKKVVHETELSLSMDVFVSIDGALRRLHVDGDKFNYAALGEARRPDGLGNFRLLLQGLRRGASSAWVNRGAQGFLSGQTVASLGYESRENYEKELRWLLTIRP